MNTILKNFSFLNKVQLLKIAILRLKDLSLAQSKNILSELDLDSCLYQKQEKILLLRFPVLVLKTKQLAGIIKLLVKNWCTIGFFFPFELYSFLTSVSNQDIFFFLQLFLVKKYTPGFLTNWKSQYFKLFSNYNKGTNKIYYSYPKFFIILDFKRFHLFLSEINLLNLPSILLGAFSFNPSYSVYQFNVGGSKRFLAFFFLSFFASILSYLLKFRYLFLSSYPIPLTTLNNVVSGGDIKIKNNALEGKSTSTNYPYSLKMKEARKIR